MKINTKKLVTACLTILWLIVIFSFSNQPAATSSEMSDSISYKLVVTMNDVFHCKWQEEQVIQKAQELHYPVRKVAHMTEYAIFAVLISLDIYYITEIKNKRGSANGKSSQNRKTGEGCNGYKNCKKNGVITLIIVALYASTDEIHQLFVPGRAGLFTDVLIDTAGGIIGVIVTYFVIRGLKRVIEKNEGRDL